MPTVSEIYRLSRDQDNPLATTLMETSVSQLGGAMLTTQVYSTLILEQEVFVAGNIEDQELALILEKLRQQQEQAEKDAQEYFSRLTSSLIDVIAGINGYATQYRAFSQAIESLLPLFSNESTHEIARSQINQLLNILEIDAEKKLNSVQELTNTLGTYQQRVKNNEEELKKLLDRAEKAITDETGTLKQIQEQIRDIQGKITNQIAGIVVSSLVIVGGAVVIVVGSVGTLPAGANSVSVVLAGVGLVATGTTALTNQATQLADNNRKLIDLYQQTAELNSTILTLEHIRGQVQILAESVGDISESISAISNEWSNVLMGIRDFKALVERANINDVFSIESSLRLAANSWNLVARRTNNVEVTLTTVSVKQVEDITDITDVVIAEESLS
ncbi:MAG: HBL/NHE enterotoxin family protein [Crocosphaera sp.]|nr:HBL/NHE enterotoxin family protein [Crocosphaera sp.]